ncbi:uncharacterized protein EAE97_008221 [Botrytis byssoidea]|uniref:DUF7770 domain-containing protein n=1 Tax=Botrytis byssoidea TaxID=139641 RepID=A0A9P5I9N0_9HELO|nr:uncharacterized protein EAE97_008221 [Botrytis byssoidea]KAF7935314.1 hypothetical protein EAE97_008221 [Botrytis byssoidea]
MSSRKHVKPSSSRTKPKDSRSSTRAVKESDYDLVVKAIRVTVHTTGKFFESDIRSGNHASIFLLTSNDASVRLNMTKTSADATMGTYEIKYCSYQRTNSSLRDFDLTATSQGLTVGHVLQLIEKKKRDEYQLARSGLGCRHWVKTVIRDFNDAGFISSSSPLTTEDAVNGLRYNYSKGKNPELEEIDPGTFVTDIPKKVNRIRHTNTKDSESGSHGRTGSGSGSVKRR